MSDDIINRSLDVIESNYGNYHGSNFMANIEIYFGADVVFDNIPVKQQIDSINGFWKSRLRSIDSSKLNEKVTEVKTWLVPSSNINHYIEAFEQDWLKTVYELGLI